jgi:uncharacterized protein YjbJ (UPF0337 family)
VRFRTDLAGRLAESNQYGRRESDCVPAISLRDQEQVMSINNDQLKGRIKEAGGKIKETAGKLMGNQALEAKGKVQKTFGAVQAKFGDVKQRIKGSTKRA